MSFVDFIPGNVKETSSIYALTPCKTAAELAEAIWEHYEETSVELKVTDLRIPQQVTLKDNESAYGIRDDSRCYNIRNGMVLQLVRGFAYWRFSRGLGANRAIKAGLEASIPINGKNLSLYSSDWCPSLDHGTGADILELIQAATPVRMLLLYLDYDFVNNTIYCEHAYVIDLDERGSFELYIGQEPKHQATEFRFKQFGSPNDTIPKFLTSFPLDDLPETPEDVLNKITITGFTRNDIIITDT
ncbi:hypothetical protein KEM54_001212 [Ascosphaera aggregata]|nr:hypothetical protein KEM54_001212 [Ascosphaera aggregata]